MPAILPVSSLRGYTDVLAAVGPGAPVFLTKNGHGKYAILEMADYDRLVAEKTLFAELEAGRLSGERDGWISSEDVRTHFAERSQDVG